MIIRFQRVSAETSQESTQREKEMAAILEENVQRPSPQENHGFSPANFSNWRRWIGRIWHCKSSHVENKQLGQLGTVKSFGIIVSSDPKSDLDLTVPIGCARSVNPHQLTPWDWSNFLGSRPLISNGPTEIWVFNIKKKDNTRSSQQRNKNTRLSTLTLWKIGPLPKWPQIRVPSDRHQLCPAFQPLKRSRRAWRIPWSGASIARHFYHVPPGFQHACRQMRDLCHGWSMTQHRFLMTFTRVFYMPAGKPRVRHQDNIARISNQMAAWCCALLQWQKPKRPKTWNLHLWVKKGRLDLSWSLITWRRAQS